MSSTLAWVTKIVFFLLVKISSECYYFFVPSHFDGSVLDIEYLAVILANNLFYLSRSPSMQPVVKLINGVNLVREIAVLSGIGKIIRHREDVILFGRLRATDGGAYYRFPDFPSAFGDIEAQVIGQELGGPGNTTVAVIVCCPNGQRLNPYEARISVIEGATASFCAPILIEITASSSRSISIRRVLVSRLPGNPFRLQLEVEKLWTGKHELPPELAHLNDAVKAVLRKLGYPGCQQVCFAEMSDAEIAAATVKPYQPQRIDYARSLIVRR